MSRILVVDDELGIRELFCEILAEEGHEPRAIERGRAALGAVLEFRPDLVILDLWLRDTDGFAVLEEIRQHCDDAAPAILVMTGQLGTDDETRIRALGAYEVIEKPVAFAKLLGAVQRGLARGATVAPTRRAPAAPGRPPVSDEALSELCRLPLREAREAFERGYFQRLLERCDNNVSQVARAAGMERTNLYRKLKQLGIL